jgi:hypothetical protein
MSASYVRLIVELYEADNVGRIQPGLGVLKLTSTQCFFEVAF